MVVKKHTTVRKRFRSQLKKEKRRYRSLSVSFYSDLKSLSFTKINLILYFVVAEKEGRLSVLKSDVPNEGPSELIIK